MESTSGAVTVEGLTHSNDDLVLRGGTKTFTGPTEFVRTLDTKGTTPVVPSDPVQTAVKQFPIRFAIADYRPGGRAAKEAGGAYHDMSGSCANGTWQVSGSTLASGIYYANCAVKLNGNPIGGTITVAAEGDISVSGSGAFFDPYIDGLLFLSNSTSTSAIRVDASGSTFFGYSFAERGQIVLTGASDSFFCGILADRIDIASQNLRVHGSACYPADPDRGVTGRRSDAQPGTRRRPCRRAADVRPPPYGDAPSCRRDGRRAGHHRAREPRFADGHASPAMTFSSNTSRSADGAWHAMPGTVAITVRPNAFAGVDLSRRAAERIDGTTIAAGALASWGYSAVVTLTSAQVALLLDPARVAAIRAASTFTLNPATVPVRRLFRFGEDFSATLRSLGANATAARVTIIPPAGDATVFAAPATPALATLTPGDSAVVALDSTVAGPAPRGATESDAAYLARLASFDGSLLIGTAFGRVDSRDRAVAGRRRDDADDPASADPGPRQDRTRRSRAGNDGGLCPGPLQYRVRRGVARSRSTDTVTGVGAIAVTGVPASLAAGGIRYGARHAMPCPLHRPPRRSATPGSVTWKDSANNAYGPVTDSLTTRLIAQRRLVVVKTDATSVDGSGQAVVDYDITITNIGAQTITGVALSDQLDPYTTLVPSSVRTSQGTHHHRQRSCRRRRHGRDRIHPERPDCRPSASGPRSPRPSPRA